MEKAPAAMQSGAVLNNISKRNKPDVETMVSRYSHCFRYLSLLRYFTDILLFFNFRDVTKTSDKLVLNVHGCYSCRIAFNF